jgi:methylmalonyl-CoA mutase C-terminal domain/subunit
MSAEKIRVLMAKPGLDGHELGAVTVARALRDAGMEVIYTGLHQTPEQIAAAAIQEDVQVVGVSIYSGSHVGVMERIIAELKRREAFGQFLLLVGGPIPPEDVQRLRTMGVDEVFSSRSPMESIVQYIEAHTPQQAKV